MLGFRNLAVVSGFAAMAVMFVPVALAAQQAGDDATQPTQQAPKARQPDSPRPQYSAAPTTRPSRGGADSVLRPAAATPPERIAVEPAARERPVLAPRDDPRSVEAFKGEPDATDR